MAKPPYLDALDFTDDIEPYVLAPVYTEPDAILEREQLRHVLELAFKSISEHGTPTGGSKIRARDIKMLRMVYGLDSTQPLPHYRVGDVFDMSGNRVSQIIYRIFERLKMPETNLEMSDLYDYITEARSNENNN
jgi:DNA-directed RNA polymerase sigma subunit (sigma70/sigma32)